jgi:hypothetical protein
MALKQTVLNSLTNKLRTDHYQQGEELHQVQLHADQLVTKSDDLQADLARS